MPLAARKAIQDKSSAGTPASTNLPFDEWTEVFGSERPTGALLDRLTHHVHILEMNGESYRLKSRHWYGRFLGELYICVTKPLDG